MSCLDVMYHQSYGAHYLPASPAAAAAAYKAAYYQHHHHHHHHHHQQQQQVEEAVCLQQDAGVCGAAGSGREAACRGSGARRDPEEGPESGTGPHGKDSRPAEAEYLSSRCVLFTYFHGAIGDVVDEHFSRALSQPSAFSGETKATRTHAPPVSTSAGLWKDGVSLSDGQCGLLPSSLWSSAYSPSQPGSSCLPPAPLSVSVHPDFSPGAAAAAFQHPEAPLWAGHGLPQAPGLPGPASLPPDAWPYGLGPQASAAGYPHIHEAYPHGHAHARARAHVHARRPHQLLHSHAPPALDPRFSPLLLPGARPQSHGSAHSPPGSHASPHGGEALKAELDPSGSPPPTAWPPALHGPLEVYDSAVEQDKVKASVWF